jgi:hypothetical protein
MATKKFAATQTPARDCDRQVENVFKASQTQQELVKKRRGCIN